MSAMKEDLEAHLDTHGAVKPYKCPSEGCEYTNSSKSAVNTYDVLPQASTAFINQNLRNSPQYGACSPAVASRED